MVQTKLVAVTEAQAKPASEAEITVGSSVAKPYQPTPKEIAAKDRYKERKAQRTSARIKVSDKGIVTTNLDHPDPNIGTINLLNAFGTGSYAFGDGLLRQITQVCNQGGKPNEADINFVLAAVSGVEPRDEIEAMLAVQMATVHKVTMTFAMQVARSKNIHQQEAAERSLNKLARTFTTQMEALKRYRSTGQQTVRVERVTVEAGGQAVVGAVNVPSAGGGGGSR